MNVYRVLVGMLEGKIPIEIILKWIIERGHAVA
jgi:hypothetical protein